MEKKLTQEELLFIKEAIDFYKNFAAKTLKMGALITALGVLFGHLVIGFSLNDTMLMTVGTSLIIIYTWYNVFEKPKNRLKQDFERGIKIIQVATVNKIKKSKEGKIYLMNNELEVKESDFDDDEEIKGSIDKGSELILTYTPYHKMILNIQRNRTAPNQV
ncbi:hypothetical protein I5M27_14520 [Adhaeribacter sp. BT258]|uniref:Uncharacterized protein n=1 Tax=Adhaeribacter terrigena TaxID=2793070 RepID=A0ABS1C4C1_9BACT|nr:hypothetical protein [Adhaeribacter terrigena]MBK0404207.1 hypothetical protein [Adhaeribacter terrigena]